MLKDLNSEQRRAVETTEGSLLILAGAGSGKTKTLTHRMAYLLASGKATPFNILAVTFTNKAAGEMRQRVAKILGQNPENRTLMPYLGTFHSICVRLLRQDGESIGVPRNFVIWDESDRHTAIKKASRQSGINEKNFPPRLLTSLISSAKNEMVEPEEFMATASGQAAQAAAKVYPLYEKALREAGALDFDDLISQTVRMLKTQKEVREKWQKQFTYIMIDEYQDTNASQYQLIKMLTGSHQNIAVVGDDWQCLLPGTLIETKEGPRKIEAVTNGELVKSASGYGYMAYLPVINSKKFNYEGQVIRIKTASGKELICTPNHLLFGRWDKTDSYLVYLMYASDKGYRIGIAKGTRLDGKKDDTGLRVRANQERADRMWVLKACKTREEATYTEALLAYKYGIPMLVFRSYNNRSMAFSQKSIDKIYKAIDTDSSAQKLMSDLGLAFEYPHFLPQATTRNSRKRINVNMVLFGDKRGSGQSPWSASRMSVNTTDPQDLQAFAKLDCSIRSARAGTFRAEIHNLDYGKIEHVLTSLKKTNNAAVEICRYAFLTSKKFSFLPASQIHPGMWLPIIADDQIIEDQVVSINKEFYSGFVYDLDVKSVHNYIASGVVVHNSIYSWRGADFRNILNFENDYKNCTVIKLEQNYRSTKNILEAAHSVISHNRQRSDKKLWTDLGAGSPVQVLSVSSERVEAETILRRVKMEVDIKARNYKDFAVLYRTNAQSRAIEEVLVRFGVPYRIVGNVRFYDRKEIKDIMAYLRLIYQPEDFVSFARVVNVPARGIGAKSLQTFEEWRVAGSYSLHEGLNKVAQCTELTQKARAGLSQLADIVNSYRVQMEELAPGALIDGLIRRLDYLNYLSDGTVQGEARIENVKELLTVAAEYADLGLSGFLEEVSLVSDLDRTDFNSNAVTLMTIHAAKGLEFPVVFITGLEEGVFPHSRALYDANELEEERRLMYVAMTRAKEELYLMYATTRALYGGRLSNPSSRFLSDIEAPVTASPGLETLGDLPPDSAEPRYIPELSEGDGVKHKVFGIGTVMELEGDLATIYFKGKGAKKLDIGFAPLEKL